MQTKDFHFDIPERLIAQTPCTERGCDKLLFLDKKTGQLSDHLFSELPTLIKNGTLMVFNDSRVRRARIFATAESSGNSAEFLLIANIEIEGLPSGSVWKVMAKNAKRHKDGRRYSFPDGTGATIRIGSDSIYGHSEFRMLEFDKPIGDAWLEINGHLPLPPYIHRKDGLSDAERYQTVYSRNIGSVAAPTAGLHFTQEVLSSLDARDIERVTVTLHVGLGTFLPVRAVNLEDHTMHEEIYSVSESTAEKVNKAKREGRPILAVGTTSVRTLESAWDTKKGELTSGEGSTRIFMYPGYEFKVIDQMFTNFHTSESTLLMLVSAFAGKEKIFNAYKHAIENEYRFFSYGDAMLIR